MPFDYIASPYSSPVDEVKHARFLLTEIYTAWCLTTRQFVYSPIVHCHAIAHSYALPTDANYWLEYNLAMLAEASHLRVLQLPGWEHSKGVEQEMHYASTRHIKVRLISWEFVQEIRDSFKKTS